MSTDATTVVALERRLLQPEVRAAAEQTRALLHQDFVEYGKSGRVWDREAIVEAMAATPEVSGEAVDLRPVKLAEGVVLLTYRIPGPEGSVRSSIWVRGADGRWRLRFHQGTLSPS
jgi:hypothetical protein